MGLASRPSAKLVAELLGVDFTDADEQIVRVDGRTIPEIFDQDGAPAFREIERQVVLDLLTRGGVVSLGGGAVMTPAIADALGSQRVVYLSIDPDAGFARAQGGDRPLLVGDDPGNPVPRTARRTAGHLHRSGHDHRRRRRRQRRRDRRCRRYRTRRPPPSRRGTPRDRNCLPETAPTEAAPTASTTEPIRIRVNAGAPYDVVIGRFAR